MSILIEVVSRVLQIKKFCSLNELASISGKKKLDVLRAITDNKKLLRFDKKGNIVGFVDVRSIQITKGMESGKYYSVTKINYGYQPIIVWNHKKAETLKEPYWCGGIGDSWRVDEILDTPENRKKIERLGVICADTIGKNDLHSIEYFWDKPALVTTILGL